LLLNKEVNKTMKLIHLFFIFFIAVFILLAAGCSPTNSETSKNREADTAPPATADDPVAIVNASCKGAATTGQIVPPGKTGRTVVVLEETHDSVAVQLELAAVLVRLHATGLTDVVLEGYLKDDASGAARKPLNRDWFRNAAGSLPVDVQRETAARLLKEGEISAAEFFFLAYDDARLLPAETLGVRGGEYGEKHSGAVIKAITGISEAVLQEAAAKGTIDVQKFNQLANQAKSATGDEAKKQSARAVMNYIATLDPWLKTAYGTLTDPDLVGKASLNDQARLHEELVVQAKKRGVAVDAALLEEGAQFFRQREKANEPIVASTLATEPRLVALNIGAAHTGGILESLKAKGLGVIVVTPLSLRDGTGKLTNTQFDAKQHLRSVFDAGQIARALKVLPTKKKPEPSITESWCQAKGELYLFISRLTRDILGPPTPPGGGQPPFGFNDGVFRGGFFFIDPRRVRYLAGDKAIVFPITSKDDPGKVLLWVKSTKSDLEGMPASVVSQSGMALAPVADADRLVALLLAHRDAVKARGESPMTAEDRPAAKGSDMGIMQIDIKTLAVVGSNETAVAAAVVGSR
jgi:hypothetical protein